MHRKLFYSLLLMFPVLAFAQQDSIPLFQIYSVEKKKVLSFDKMIDGLKKADVVFFGEEHNDSIAHVLQLQVLQALHQQHKNGITLSMEMFQTDVQFILDEYLQGIIQEKNLQADGRLWKNYKDYRPLVEYARANNIDVLAANAPSRYTNRVTRNGLESLNVLNDHSRSFLAPLPIDTLTGRYYDKFAGLMGGHENMGNLKIYQSQNVWDATMAWNIARRAENFKKQQILHLNGRFHSDEKLGTVAQLKKYSPNLKVMTITSFSPENFQNPDWNEWKDLADFIIITSPDIPRTF
ncbi:ChaN family lipoprotein [Gynurincola endophyticus]|uniref:ChaN family lipoprotein n=1 Tax=Gynurincola endophyticus TaxID=2479004 RepID=UPI000F8EEDEC|nr:ChaN family lipoprotein [Gynurincola endophyticus]